MTESDGLEWKGQTIIYRSFKDLPHRPEDFWFVQKEYRQRSNLVGDARTQMTKALPLSKHAT